MDEWDTLLKKCPNLYRKGIYFECGSGWYDIIHDLSLKIEDILESGVKTLHTLEDEEFSIREMFVEQVKEKYGTLRFYMSWETDEISDLIRKAEVLSSQTCEKCGAPGKMRGVKRFEVKCDQCYQG